MTKATEARERQRILRTISAIDRQITGLKSDIEKLQHEQAMLFAWIHADNERMDASR
jgi:hypothetical protein